MSLDHTGEMTEADGPGAPWMVRSEDQYGQAAMTTTTYEYLPAGDAPTKIVFTGTCPRCTHLFTFEWPLEIFRGDTEDSVVVLCVCASPHAGRPDGESAGCGAYWSSRVQS
jgi:hypothetical protein